MLRKRAASRTGRKTHIKRQMNSPFPQIPQRARVKACRQWRVPIFVLHPHSTVVTTVTFSVALDANVTTIVDAFRAESPGVEGESTSLRKLRQPYSVGFQGADAIDERIASQGLDNVCETFNRRRTIRSFVDKLQEYESSFMVIVLPLQTPTIVDSRVAWARDLHNFIRRNQNVPFEQVPGVPVPCVNETVLMDSAIGWASEHVPGQHVPIPTQF
ncbi:uncharacterized protein BXZ73DRAFT_101879 [Epithele typhae]|uniref:uncharacterized protein n=1 Tax=Epithele typhae TaxID=378194 RepID=UPI00200896F0|nr:uncharacterized protein BXZ73DRAFT_101879 [Epithele typhae]KAH9930509.1 hypothetical protein BXZ73DRAFT_101879 [Epithele typhae]